MLKEFKKDRLTVKVYGSRAEMGDSAAREAAAVIRQLLHENETINAIFAAAPSQNEFLDSLQKEGLDWSRINAFHMDEYMGLHPDAPQGFGNFLREKLFGKASFKTVNYLNGNTENADEEADRYARLLEENPVDIVLMGIGENTHIAFNDPHVANFSDSKLVKMVDLDEACRRKQVNDGCFGKIEEVPNYALTLTVPALLKAKYIFCMVPSEKKAQAVQYTLKEEVQKKYPSTILREHPNATLYLDKDSAKQI